MSDDFRLHTPFVIDGDGYSDRDRAMFVAGYEFGQISRLLEDGEPFERPIHSENTDRVRVLCSRAGRACEVTVVDETWSNLVVMEPA